MGKVRIGGADAVPDYGYMGWFAMLFAAGMGIGLMFFGVLEPIYHFNNPPLGLASPIGAGRRADSRGRRGGARGRHGRHHLPLGPAPLGDLRGRRAVAGARRLQQGPAAVGPFGLLSDLRRAHPRLDRPLHRHPGRVCHAVRAGDLARLRRRAGAGRAELPLRRAGDRHRQGAADRRHHRRGAAVGAGRARRRRQAPVGDQHGAGRAAARLRHPARADRRTGERLLRQHRRLCDQPAGAVQPVRPHRQRFRAWLDDLLLGLVDFLVALRRHVHRPHLQGPHGARIHHLRAAGAVAGLDRLDDGVRRHRDDAAASPTATRACRKRSSPTRRNCRCSGCSSRCRWPASPR